MAARYLGIVASGTQLVLVLCRCDAEITPEMDETWTLQDGSRPKAYAVIYERLRNFVTERKIEAVIIKASALGKSAAKMGHLEAAELRGVVQAAAAAAGVDVRTPKKAALSRTFGDRKVDEYLTDDGYWATALAGIIRKGSREAALLILSDIK